MIRIPFVPVPQDVNASDDYLRRLSTVALNVQNGKLNNINDLTLDIDTTTTVSDQRVGANSVILFMPLSSESASELYSGNMFVSSRGTQTFTITHTASGTNREFSYVVFG